MGNLKAVETLEENIRAATREELPELAQMLYQSELGKKYYPSEKTLLNIMLSSIENDDFFIILNKEDDKEEKAGFIWFQREGAFHTYMYLHMIFLKDQYRHLGYGKILMDFLEACSLMHNGKEKLQNKIFLVVGSWNESAIKFYKALGFSFVSIIPGLFRKKLDENIMMKECFRLS